MQSKMKELLFRECLQIKTLSIFQVVSVYTPSTSKAPTKTELKALSNRIKNRGQY
jgi:hypothetical protein